MCLLKNFVEVLKTPILQNTERLLLLRHLKMKIEAPNKFLVLMRKFWGKKTNMVSNRPEWNVWKKYTMYTNAVATCLEY